MPLVGFYLQTAVGGIPLPMEFWRRFALIENVVAITQQLFHVLKGKALQKILRRYTCPGREQPVKMERTQAGRIGESSQGGLLMANALLWTARKTGTNGPYPSIIEQPQARPRILHERVDPHAPFVIRQRYPRNYVVD